MVVIMSKDFIFVISLDKTIHLGMNPRRGGTPAIERIKIEVCIFIFLLVWFVKFFMLSFIIIIINGIEIDL